MIYMSIHQYVGLLGTYIPWYGICVGLALLGIGIWMVYSFKKFAMNGDQQNEILLGFPFMVLTGVLIAFFLDAFFTGDWRTWNSVGVRRMGLTFTGWLLGVLVFLFIYGRFTSFGWFFLFNMFLPIIALAQGIGRIGCFLGGCCYGRVCSWGVCYPKGSMAYERLGEVTVFPVQLIEAIWLVVLFAICLKVVFHYRACVYLFGVSLVRFIMEFFRGDMRGSIFGCEFISPQQWMSVVFALIGVALLFVARKKKNDSLLQMRAIE